MPVERRVVYIHTRRVTAESVRRRDLVSEQCVPVDFVLVPFLVALLLAGGIVARGLVQVCGSCLHRRSLCGGPEHAQHYGTINVLQKSRGVANKTCEEDGV